MTDPDASAVAVERLAAAILDSQPRSPNSYLVAAALQALAAERDALAARLAAAEAELRQRHGDTYTVNPAAEWQAQRIAALEADAASARKRVRELCEDAQHIAMRRSEERQAYEDRLNVMEAERDALRAALTQLCDWIEDECGCELPFDARTLAQKGEE